MPNSGYIRNRDYPPYFDHPQLSDQLTKEQFKALPTREVEEHGGICEGHILTKVHLAEVPGNRRFIVEVVLETGHFYIEAPCTFTPAMGLDVLDGNLVNDAEEWILVQELRMKPRRLRVLFGHEHRRNSQDYVQAISGIRAGGFAEIPVEFMPPDSLPPLAKKKRRWWKFWEKPERVGL